MTYEERLRRFEQDKRKLQEQSLSDIEYMQAIKKLADKWRV